MANYIPRLEWNPRSVTATRTASDPVLASIASTTEINVGMIASGTGIPSGAEVISKTVNSVTLSANATLSGTSVINFVERLDFDFPPSKDSEEEYKPKQTITESLSGLQQTVTNFLEATRKITVDFLTTAKADKLKTNFYIYVYKGNTFTYYPDKDEAPSFTYELDKRDFARIRQVKKHPLFLYQLQMSFRRVVE
jgi:hypothetical protein